MHSTDYVQRKCIRTKSYDFSTNVSGGNDKKKLQFVHNLYLSLWPIKTFCQFLPVTVSVLQLYFRFSFDRLSSDAPDLTTISGLRSEIELVLSRSKRSNQTSG